MFKKKPTIKPLAPLRSSDRRKLADQIIKDYALEATQSDEADTAEKKTEQTNARTALRNALLPENCQSARFTTTHGPELKQASGTVYVGSYDGGEARILWFAIEGRMYPSVYTVWRNPDIVPLLHTPSIVISKLTGGADLMIPGLAGGPPFPERAKKGAVVAVASTDKPSVPVVVGWCEIDVSVLEKVQGGKGHAVRNLHWVGDEAWGYGGSGKSGQQAPDDILGWNEVLEARGLSDKVEALDMEDQDEEGGVAVENGTTQEDVIAGQTNGHAEAADSQDQPTLQEEARELSQNEIDEAFRNAFLYGVYKHKTSNANTPNFGLVFPLSQSFVMSNLIQPFLPVFTSEQEKQLQMKKTSWKNIKKFIRSMDKDRILRSKEKDGHETVIMDIDFEDAHIVDFKPYRLPKKETVGGAAQGRGEKATDQIEAGDSSVGQKLQVVSYFKPTTKLQPLFDKQENKQLLTPPEVREIVTRYVEAENLVSETNKRLVKLDPTLGNAVFDGSGTLDKEVLAKGSVPRDALIDRVLNAMTAHYVIQQSNGGDSSKPKSGTPPKVHITLETRSGNKTVTKVSGLEAYFINPKLLADELRKVCAGSTSVEPLAGATKKNEKPVEEVMVQGPQKDAVIKALERRGVERRWIEVLDKTKGKKSVMKYV